METSPLATESFSYSWLTNVRPSVYSLDEFLGPSNMEEADSFNFDILVSESSTFVHADEIFSDGHILPTYVTRSTSIPSIPISSLSSRNISPTDRSTYYQILWKWKRSSNKLLRRCFEILRPFYQSVGCSRKSIRVDDIDRKVAEVQSWSSSLQASPRLSTSCCGAGDLSAVKKSSNQVDIGSLRKVKSWSNLPQQPSLQSPASYCRDVSCDTESSIYEAVLHCKRSIGALRSCENF